MRPFKAKILDAIKLRYQARLIRHHFDEGYYRKSNPDINFRGISPLLHYAAHGWREGRDPSPLFSTTRYLDRYADVRDAGVNPLVHYVRYGIKEARVRPPSRRVPLGYFSAIGRRQEDRTDDLVVIGRHFDEQFYRLSNPDVDFTSVSPIEHFATVGWREGRDPCAEFSVTGYVAAHPDVTTSPDNPYVHYLRTGIHEGRTISVAMRSRANGYSEWIGYDRVTAAAARRPAAGRSNAIKVGFSVSIAPSNLEAHLERLKRSRHARPDQPAEISIVIPCKEQGLLTTECLTSIANALASSRLNVEVIVVDNGSRDTVCKRLVEIPWLKVVRHEHNLGFGPACNSGAAVARGEHLFFLNNDAQISPGCLEALIEALSEPSAGLVGPKLLNFDGSLQEAGCRLNPDGTGNLIGFGQDPHDPRFNYRREVEHVSGAAILLKRALFDEMGGFDDLFAPAYCEDADLSLKIRSKGLSIIYEPSAVVAHHLSKTSQGDQSTTTDAKKRLVARNRQRMVERWADDLIDAKVRTIAFHLPQYHPIPENDVWWGKGFTEWTNVSKAAPNYHGHRQPRRPADLGYYDLRLPQALERQAALARRYGLFGFCFYYYWFSGRRLLETPLDNMLADKAMDFPFCLCWANENWTRRWDGHDSEVLMRQVYSDDHAVGVIDDLARYLRAPNYIRVNGKPLLLIYRVDELPNARRMTDVWRDHCRGIGLGEICIALVESFGLSPNPQHPAQFGCDLTVEFPIHGMVQDPPLPVTTTNHNWSGSAHDYRKLAELFMTREDPGFKRIRSVMAGWDSTPRHPNRSLVLEYATPGAFQAWLEWTLRRTCEQNYGDERMVFINAWNEWGEGSYLEPDDFDGHGYLEALRNAIDACNRGGRTFAA